MTLEASNGRCYKCGGPLLHPGGVEQDGQEVHAVCSRTENGDPDMNPEAQARKRDTVRYIRARYGGINNAPNWMVRVLLE